VLEVDWEHVISLAWETVMKSADINQEEEESATQKSDKNVVVVLIRRFPELLASQDDETLETCVRNSVGISSDLHS
jgi:hypothetical protein